MDSYKEISEWYYSKGSSYEERKPHLFELYRRSFHNTKIQEWLERYSKYTFNCGRDLPDELQREFNLHSTADVLIPYGIREDIDAIYKQGVKASRIGNLDKAKELFDKADELYRIETLKYK